MNNRQQNDLDLQRAVEWTASSRMESARWKIIVGLLDCPRRQPKPAHRLTPRVSKENSR